MSDAGTALVTGGSRGIGRACALELAQRGFDVWVGYKEREDAAAATCEAIARAGGRGRPLRLDVADPPSCEGAFQRIGNQGVAALVHAAGVQIESLVARSTRDPWDVTLATNLSSFFHLARLASPRMIRARGGSIVAIGSVIGRTGLEMNGAYCASKSGLVGLARTLARELGRFGIRVNVVSPGWIDTDMTRGRRLEIVLPRIPLGRVGRSEEVAHAVGFLCSQEASYVTGAVLPVSGGLDM